MPSDSSSGRPSLLKRIRALWELSSGVGEAKPWSPAEAGTTVASRGSSASEVKPSPDRETEPVPWTPPRLESPATREQPTTAQPV